MTDSPQDYLAIPYRGVAISGAEAGSDVSYAYQGMPTIEDMSYFIEHGMNSMRFPIRWSYITEDGSAAVASAEGEDYLAAVHDSLQSILAAGVNVVLDLHSYMRYSAGSYAGSGNEIASAQDIYNVWSIIAKV